MNNLIPVHYNYHIYYTLSFSGGIRVNFTGTGMNVSQSPQLNFPAQEAQVSSQLNNNYCQRLAVSI